MEHTTSATELMPVVVEPNGSGGADVWLNRNITKTEIDADGLSQTMWEAEQVHYVSGSIPDPATIAARFEEIWDEHVGASDVTLSELSNALADLSGVVSAGMETMQVYADAIAELSELVSDRVGGEQ